MITPDVKRRIRNEKEFFVPIMKILQDCGGEVADRSEFAKYLPSYTDFTDEDITHTEITSKGNNYQPYLFGRNLALTNLKLAGFLNCEKRGPVTLTQKGLNQDIEKFNYEIDVYKNSNYLQHKEDLKSNSKSGDSNDLTKEEEGPDNLELDAQEMSKVAILNRLKGMDAYKFEKFINGLLSKMGFQIDPSKGTTKSNDGGIDGFAYSYDQQSLTNSTVVIQSKCFSDGTIGRPEIDKFRGAIQSHHADYGIFVTTTTFSQNAKDVARDITPRITLIDGAKLVDIMIQNKYKVRPVITWEVDEEYFGL